MNESKEAVLVEALRTPVGKYGGALSAVRPDDLAARVIAAVVERSGVPRDQIEDVYMGCANQAGEDNRNVARMAALLAGLPQSVAGCTVNRLCASGLEAVNCAARAVLAGEGEIFIAGGVESMSRAPWVLPKAKKAFTFGNLTAYDSALGWRFPNRRLEKLFPLESMGETAENIRERFWISRLEQDRFALASHRKAAKAAQSGLFKEEIVPVSATEGRSAHVDSDETIRLDASLERLSKLKPAFRLGGTVTAGNSSSLNDGAAAVLVMSSKKAKALGLKPLARWVGSAVAGVDPRTMGLGPVPATRKLLERTGVRLEKIDLVELNEAFAVQSLACIRELGLDPEKVNVNGGAIALGHPLGCSGARVLTTLLHEMKRRKARYGLAALCVGVGQGIAALVERIH
ncbi:MAG: beta-ketoadipyl CoA thiolase [Elusimicrobia bacterium RIFCSPLOWO2_12_FULL_59_9]|nr:MAG: beta-ketoadipyl CoA thiolase [Elusimicrobia bacterium RIFCSPLOWO2_12_FULL_59_9]